jgi:integrase
MLTDTQIRNLKPKDKLYRKTDSHGLTLEITVSGSKIWLQRYRYNNKPTMMTLGHYPEMSLLDARQARDANKQLLKQNINPKDNKNKLTLSGLDFNEAFLQWHGKNTWSEDYSKDVSQRAGCHLLPFIGNNPIEGITTPDMIKVLKRLEDVNKLDTLDKIRGIASRVFSYAVGMGYITVNPVRDLPKDIFKQKQQKNYATITDPKEIGWLLRTIDGHKGSWQVRSALLLIPHVFLRPGELVKMTWDEVDFNDKLIRIKGDRMKMKLEHLVPMSKQVFSTLKDLSQIQTNSKFVFPTPRNKNDGITTSALLVSLRSLGIDTDTFTTHGYRSMASTRLNEMGLNGDAVEMQLSHRDANKIRNTYNHAQYLDDRKDMMQVWSDYLDKLKREI